MSRAYHPFVYFRDEIDLLEDEQEDLFAQYHSHSTKMSSDFGDVFHEYLETEEYIDAEIVLIVGSEAFLSPSPHGQAIESQEMPSLMPQTEFFQDLFYRMMRACFDDLKIGLSSYQKTDAVVRREMVRLQVNMNACLLKSVSALGEQGRSEAVSRRLAKRHYQSALLYLHRMIESARNLMALGFLFEEFERQTPQIFTIRQELEKRFRSFSTGRPE